MSLGVALLFKRRRRRVAERLADPGGGWSKVRTTKDHVDHHISIMLSCYCIRILLMPAVDPSYFWKPAARCHDFVAFGAEFLLILAIALCSAAVFRLRVV